MAEAASGAESGYHEIFAAFFVGASEAESHYYSFKTLNDEISNLVSLLGLSQENLNTLLVASNFGSLQKNGPLEFSKNIPCSRNHGLQPSF
jgi:hypothetical protein